MKRLLPFALVACLGAALTATAQTPEQYSQFRQDEPRVNEAIDAMASSDMHGTLNRLSALYHRSGIEALAMGDGHEGATPENFDRNLAATLADLAEDVNKYDLEALNLTLQQKVTLLELVQIYGFERPMELWDGAPFTRCPDSGLNPCPTTDPECEPTACLDTDSDVVNSLDQLAEAARFLYSGARTAAGNPADTATALSLHGENFLANVNTVVSRLTGVESIDD